MSKEFDFDFVDKIYHNSSREELDLLAEKTNLEAKLAKINEKLKELGKNTIDAKIKIIDNIEKLYPPHRQTCTCSTGLPSDLMKYSQYVKCLKHLSRYFHNTGC
jgi:hypothetical protein